MVSTPRSTFDELLAEARAGRLTRRQVLLRGVALGLTTGSLGALLAACGASATATVPAPTATTAAKPTTAPSTGGGATTSAASSSAATSAASSAATSAASSSAASTAATSSNSAASTTAAAAGKRGGAGTVKVLWWQAPSILNPHLGTGTKDFDGSRPVYEPLATFDQSEKLIPVLAAELPSTANGGVAADGKSVTWKLKQGVKWSDGQPFTADDVVFTWEYATDKETGAVTLGIFQPVAKVEKTDDYTVKITFSDVTPGWYTIFTSTNGCILPKHIFQDYKGTKAKDAPANLKPTGTGPYKVTDFKPGDTIAYVINENYRDPGKPSYDQIQLKGGGDAVSAARAVMLTGEYDFAWNLQVEASILDQLAQQGQKGELVVYPGASAERVMINFTDPNKEVDGERSSIKAPHPFQADPKVRQAYNLLVDRDTIAKTLYGKTGVATPNNLNAPQSVYSKNTKYEFNIDKANQLLEEAGYKKGSDGFRAKGDVKMSVLFQTSVNTLRQKEQQLIKDAFEKAGIKMELKSVDQTVFFSTGAGQTDNYPHFYTDLEMYTNGPDLPDSQNYLRRYISSQVCQKANNWGGTNITRYQNKAMDDFYDKALVELDPDKRSQLFIQMNDLSVSDVVEIPIVARTGAVAVGKTLKWSQNSPWDSNLWDTADWTKR
ncbi:MAG: peptide ABC transporter substrate-binding protein [Thermomicrobiales bacterium]|jgi:peptide/nickel transport system substrate-binding protein